MIYNFLIAFLISLCIFGLMQWAKNRLLGSVPRGRNIRLSTVIIVSGSAPELENTVKALVWLRQSGRLDAEIVLRNCGMDEETASVAEKLARRGDVKLIF